MHFPVRSTHEAAAQAHRKSSIYTDCEWWLMPNDVPPWHTMYQQTQSRLKAGVFEAMVPDLRAVLRFAAGRPAMRVKRSWMRARCSPIATFLFGPNMLMTWAFAASFSFCLHAGRVRPGIPAV
jgi:hypothetical protein